MSYINIRRTHYLRKLKSLQLVSHLWLFLCSLGILRIHKNREVVGLVCLGKYCFVPYPKARGPELASGSVMLVAEKFCLEVGRAYT